jgi:hypothetical protein
MTEPAEKTCTCCLTTKPIDDFYLTKNGTKANKLVRKSQCKECMKSKMRKWGKENPEKHAHTRWVYDLRTTYGMTEKQWLDLLAAQGGGCAICGENEKTVHRSGAVWRLSVDHCHTTGKIRGILCNRCNRAIGLLKDDVQLLRKATDYLEG